MDLLNIEEEVKANFAKNNCTLKLSCRACFTLISSAEEVAPEDVLLWSGVELLRDERVSHHFCRRCFGDLEAARDFGKRCTQANRLLQNHIKKEEDDLCEWSPAEEHEDKNTLVKDQERPFKCTTCAKSFSVSYVLNRHMKSHVGERPHRCSQCPKAFTLKHHLKNHMKVHERSERDDLAGVFHCDACSTTFRSRADLMIHASSHSLETAHKCPMCARIFTTKQGLKHHATIHTGERTHICKLCDGKFALSCHLRRHTKLHHSDAKPFDCDLCPRRFSTNNRLTVHRRTHTGERPFVCDVCAKSFTSKETLLRHLRVHSGDRSYGCEVCAKKFRAASTLYQHRLTHAGAKPHACSTCGRSFARRTDLRVHERLHGGEARPHECGICGKAFMRSCAAAEHRRRVHGGVRRSKEKKLGIECEGFRNSERNGRGFTYVCDVCGVGFNNRTAIAKHLKHHELAAKMKFGD